MTKIEKAAADYRVARAAVEEAQAAIERHELSLTKLQEIRNSTEMAARAARAVLLETAKEAP